MFTVQDIRKIHMTVFELTPKYFKFHFRIFGVKYTMISESQSHAHFKITKLL